MSKINSLKDIIMVLLYAKGHKGKQCEPIRGRTRLVKMVFLLKKEILPKLNGKKTISKDAMPEFYPHYFGPFSPKVYADLEFLVNMEFVDVRELGKSPEDEEALEYTYWQAASGAEYEQAESEKEQEFFLTQLGKDFTRDELISEFCPEELALLDEFKARCTAASLRALLGYVYRKYPQMTVKSTIRDEILREK